jgi:hypothetical protein
MTDETSGNGRFLDEDEADDDAPLTPDEASMAAAVAGAGTDETLDERVEAVVAELADVERRREDESVGYSVAGRLFAVLMEDVLEAALDPAVAQAAVKTPDTMSSARGAGWIAFTPEEVDRFALDRAEAWLRSAYRRAAGT